MNSLILLIILVPIVEIYLFIKIGSHIGAISTILLIISTAIIFRREAVRKVKTTIVRQV